MKLPQLLLVFALAAGSALGQTAPTAGKPDAKGESGERPATSIKATGSADEAPATEPAKASAEATLSAIQQYRIGLDGVEGASESGVMAELVNLFPARKRRRLHGSIYEFHRNDNLDARNFFDPLGEALPEFKRNQFGFNLGTSIGPLSLWGSYDGLRIIQGSTLISHVPTPAQKRGDFSALDSVLVDPLSGEPFAGNIIPSHRIDPVAQGLLAVYPDPNREDPDRNFDNSRPRINNQDSWEIRADYSIDDTNKLFVRFFTSSGDEEDVEPLPTFGEISRNGNRNVELAYNWTASPQLVLAAELNFWRWFNFETSLNAGKAGLLQSLGISGVSAPDAESEGFPEFEISGYADFGDSRSPNSGVNNTLEPRLTVTWAKGAHTFQMGGQVQFTQSNNNRSGGLTRGEFEFEGTFSGDAFADFLLGLPLSATRASGTDRIDLRNRLGRVFFQDQWRVNSKLDLTLGLAYNWDPPFRSVRDDVSTFFPLLFEPPMDGEIVIAGTPRASQLGFDRAGNHSLVFSDRNNWEPILGLAYSPTGNQSLVLRSSYRIDYIAADRGRYIRNLGRNFPFYFVESAQSPSDHPELALATPFEAATATELTIRGIDPHVRTTYNQRWNLSLQSEIWPRWVLEAAYRGEKGTHLMRSLPANIPLPGDGAIQPRRPNPAFGSFSIQSGGASSIRHAMNVRLTRRLADGFSLRTDFTWSRAINDLFRRPGNPRNLAAERAPSSFEPPRRLTLNYIWELPFEARSSPRWLRAMLGGWRLSGITRIRSGRPFSVFLSGDLNNDGFSGDRPDRVESGRTAFVPSVDEWFDTTAFADPSGDFGNAGRNILYAPSHQIWDISLSKQARISDSDILEVRIEFFNAFNHVNFDRPDTTFGTSVFGTIFGAGRAREIEIALKYSF